MITGNVAENVILQGIGISPGIVIARALPFEPGGIVRKRKLDSVALVEPEQERFRNAVARTEEKLRLAREQFSALMADYASIIDTHSLILRDKKVFDQTLKNIADKKINAEWALETTLSQIEEMFARMEDSYIRSRFLDVRQVADRVFTELSGADTWPYDAGQMAILVARDFSPEEILQMNDQVGFLAEMGGETSHSAIVARALGIPAVVGLRNICSLISANDLIILDGARGRVHINPDKNLLDYYRDKQIKYRHSRAAIVSHAHLRAETLEGLFLTVQANLEISAEVSQALEYGADGIGLFRSEYLYLTSADSPDEEFLFKTYKDLLSVASPLPVTIRTFDLGADKKFISRPGQSSEFCRKMAQQWSTEANPALGLRAIRYCLHEPRMFETQLRAIFRASVFGRVRILFPMISSYCELINVKKIIASVQKELLAADVPFDENIEFGVMIEVPSAVMVADALAQEVDFFSIGTNDLIQYSLAIDRGNEQVSHMYEPLHPAILRMISQVVGAAHGAGIEVEICGEMAGEEKYLPLLLGLGLDSVSMHPQAIPYIKRMIRQSETESTERLAEILMQCASAAEVREYLQNYLVHNYPEIFPADDKSTFR